MYCRSLRRALRPARSSRSGHQRNQTTFSEYFRRISSNFDEGEPLLEACDGKEEVFALKFLDAGRGSDPRAVFHFRSPGGEGSRQLVLRFVDPSSCSLLQQTFATPAFSWPVYDGSTLAENHYSVKHSFACLLASPAMQPSKVHIRSSTRWTNSNVFLLRAATRSRTGAYKTLFRCCSRSSFP